MWIFEDKKRIMKTSAFSFRRIKIGKSVELEVVAYPSECSELHCKFLL